MWNWTWGRRCRSIGVAAIWIWASGRLSSIRFSSKLALAVRFEGKDILCTWDILASSLIPDDEVMPWPWQCAKEKERRRLSGNRCCLEKVLVKRQLLACWTRTAPLTVYPTTTSSLNSRKHRNYEMKYFKVRPINGDLGSSDYLDSTLRVGMFSLVVLPATLLYESEFVVSIGRATATMITYIPNVTSFLLSTERNHFHIQIYRCDANIDLFETAISSLFSRKSHTANPMTFSLCNCRNSTRLWQCRWV